jgi:mRNA (2'-O-methyladenosine-N6-)-methyltransferase
MAEDGVSMQVSEKFLMRNDYSQTFIDTGLRPQNYIRDLDYQNRYSEYPKIERLIKLKDDILAKRATPGMSLKCDLKSFDLSSLGTKFDVILLTRPGRSITHVSAGCMFRTRTFRLGQWKSFDS